MKKKEMIETIFDEMTNLAGGRMPESNDLAKRHLTCRELDGLYLPKEADPEFSDQCRRYNWNASRAS